jgi:hypothetical protein
MGHNQLFIRRETMYKEDCPECGVPQEIDHDDGYGYEEDEIYEQECNDCGKTFVYTTTYIMFHTVEKAPCQNGGKHKMEPVTHAPRHWPDWVRCKFCGHEVKGKFVNVDIKF